MAAGNQKAADRQGRFEMDLFDSEPSPSPAEVWDQDVTKRTLDELFVLAHQYHASEAYDSLLRFIARFRFYAPFNCMLVHIQMPGARFVAPPHRWAGKYGRRIKPGARPLVILKPMGPVMFVFDVSDTEGRQLPKEVVAPYETRSGQVGLELERTIENARRDGVSIHGRRLGSQAAGSISTGVPVGGLLRFGNASTPLRYELELNEDFSRESRYATVAHELAHLYCGHLGTPNSDWWPDRQGHSDEIMEFEAESVAYLLCGRLNIDNPSEIYLAFFLDKHPQVPPISLECVMKAAGLIENMGRKLLEPRTKKTARH